MYTCMKCKQLRNQKDMGIYKNTDKIGYCFDCSPELKLQDYILLGLKVDEVFWIRSN